MNLLSLEMERDTAIIMITPFTASCIKGLTPINIIQFCITVMLSTPTNDWNIPPLPPDSAAPPTTKAVIVVNKLFTPMLNSPL